MGALGRIMLIALVVSHLLLSTVHGQITYFDQGFDGSGPFESAAPGVGQFDKIVKTNSSSFQFANGAMELIRAQNPDPKSTSGLVKAVRSSAFSPTPETLYIQMTLTAKNISTVTSNAVYFYVGENFNPNDNTIPGNLLMFSRISLNFTSGGVVVHDFQKNINSAPIALNTSFTLTWVLNNSAWGQVYKFPETASVANYKVMPYRYDLWVNGLLLVDEASGYPLPGSGTPNPYSSTKLTNFEIRFRDGFGTLGVDHLLIRDINGVLPVYISDFESKLEDESVRLSWTATLQPEMPERYLVQRSMDGTGFVTIGMVRKWEDEVYTYQYSDFLQDSGEGRFFYRVVAIDGGGRTMEVSLLRTVFRQFQHQLPFVYSNPSEASLIQVYDAELGSEYRLFSKAGISIPARFSRGAAKEILLYPDSYLPSGIYILAFMYRGMPRQLRVAVH